MRRGARSPKTTSVRELPIEFTVGDQDLRSHALTRSGHPRRSACRRSWDDTAEALETAQLLDDLDRSVNMAHWDFVEQGEAGSPDPPLGRAGLMEYLIRELTLPEPVVTGRCKRSLKSNTCRLLGSYFTAQDALAPHHHDRHPRRPGHLPSVGGCRASSAASPAPLRC